MKYIFINLILILTFVSCSSDSYLNKIIPQEVDSFTKQFINDIQNGDIELCLTKVIDNIKNEESRTFLTNVSQNIKNYNLESLTMINGKFTRKLGEDPITTYTIEYEKQVADGFLYLIFNIRESNGVLKIAMMNGRMMESSLSEVNQFTFQNKNIRHYIFFAFQILSFGFIIFTIIVAIRTKIKFKWLWIIGILIAFVKFKLNWTTGEFGFRLISFQLFGAGFSKSGLVAPWIMTFSLPFVAIAFWIKKYLLTKSIEENKEFDEILEKYKEKE
ncbi:MAG: hypothetical protein Q8O72_13190 [Bacteroidales bacterium]|nr:hypothetical protein [Bacteroidales bacterium]